MLNAQLVSCVGFLLEEDGMGSYAEHHSDDTIRHQAEVPLPPLLLLLGHHLWSVRVMNLLPVTDVLIGIHADRKGMRRLSVVSDVTSQCNKHLL